MQFQQNIYVNYVSSKKREQRLPVFNISHITFNLYSYRLAHVYNK